MFPPQIRSAGWIRSCLMTNRRRRTVIVHWIFLRIAIARVNRLIGPGNRVFQSTPTDAPAATISGRCGVDRRARGAARMVGDRSLTVAARICRSDLPRWELLGHGLEQTGGRG